MFLTNVGPTLTKKLFNVLQISLRLVILQLSSVFSLFICALGLFFYAIFHLLLTIVSPSYSYFLLTK